MFSNTLPLSCGVPQGSVLGPALFLIYINDVKNTLTSVKHLLYADDAALYTSNINVDIIEDTLQNDLLNFSYWCNQNKLTVNVKKTKYVIYGTLKLLQKSRNLDLAIKGDKISREQVYKYLGIYLDSHLNFNKHIDYISRIISHKIFVLSKIRYMIDQRTAIYIFKTMIAPIFDYGDIVYEGGNKNRFDKIQRIQNRGLRICLARNDYVLTEMVHRLSIIPKLYIRRSSNLKKYMYLQQGNIKYVVNQHIPTRAHDATVFVTCIPKIDFFLKKVVFIVVSLYGIASQL